MEESGGFAHLLFFYSWRQQAANRCWVLATLWGFSFTITFLFYFF
jgi:hypothetical protein